MIRFSVRVRIRFKVIVCVRVRFSIRLYGGNDQEVQIGSYKIVIWM